MNGQLDWDGDVARDSQGRLRGTVEVHRYGWLGKFLIYYKRGRGWLSSNRNFDDCAQGTWLPEETRELWLPEETRELAVAWVENQYMAEVAECVEDALRETCDGK